MIRKFAPFLFLAAASTVANATVLTFEIPGLSNGAIIPQSYGDNVSSFTMGGITYGSGGGLTPDVTVDYVGSPGDQVGLNYWFSGYSDLTDVLEYEPDGAPNFSLVFTAAPGQLVTLESFDLGNFGSAVTLPGIRVTDQSGTTLYSQTNVPVPMWTEPHLSFSPNVTGSSLTLFFDISGLGGNSDNIGIDNIRFSQSSAPVPEPATLAALGLGLAALARRRRK